LDDVSFNIEARKVVGLIGHNGFILGISKAEIQREKLVFDPNGNREGVQALRHAMSTPDPRL